MSRLFSMLKMPKGSIKGNPTAKNQRDGFHFALRKFAYNWSGFNRYGLYCHDLLDEENLIVKEALRRLPTDVLDARTFRYPLKYSCLLIARNLLTYFHTASPRQYSR